MRVVAVEQSGSNYQSGNNCYAMERGFDEFWGPAWIVIEDPDYSVAGRVVRVETRIFSIPDKRLVWAGRRRTENPKSVDKLVESTADAVGRQLRAQGLIPKAVSRCQRARRCALSWSCRAAAPSARTVPQ